MPPEREGTTFLQFVLPTGWRLTARDDGPFPPIQQIGAEAVDTETRCRRCNGPNVSWSAPSPLWNAVMRGGSINGPWEFGELICPTCFAVLAEERGIADGWKLAASTVHVTLETVTPSGRTWDDESGLWVDTPTERGPNV